MLDFSVVFVLVYLLQKPGGDVWATCALGIQNSGLV